MPCQQETKTWCCWFFVCFLPDCPPSFIFTRDCSASLPKRKSLCNTRSSVGGRQNMSEILRYHLYYLEISLSCKGNFLSQNSEFAFPLRFNFFTTHKSNNLSMLMGIFCHLKLLELQSFLKTCHQRMLPKGSLYMHCYTYASLSVH